MLLGHPRNESRWLSLMSPLRVNSGTERVRQLRALLRGGGFFQKGPPSTGLRDLTSFACACADRHPSDQGTPLLISKPSKPQPSVPIRRDKPQFFRRQGAIDCAFGVGYRLRFSRGLALMSYP
jgi:hypothetical protein